MEYREMLHRYVGRRVCVSTFGHSKLWGELAAVNEDCLRLVNTTVSNDGDDQWLSQSQYGDPEHGYGARHSETVVHFHHIVAITCLDDDLPDPELNPSEASFEAPATGLRTQTQVTSPPELIEHRASDGFLNLRLERLEVRIGPGLISLADPNAEEGLATRMVSLRNAIGAELGLLLPSARIRDDMRLSAEEYRFYISGSEAARGSIRPGKLLAVGLGKKIPPGERTLEPIFSQPAVWIDPDQRIPAEEAGCIVIEPLLVLMTHLQNEIRRNAHELLSLDSLRLMLEQLRQTSPSAVEEVIPARLSLPRLHDLLSRLLEEQVSLRPLERILERVAHLPHCEEMEQMLELLRRSIGRLVCERHRDEAGRLPVVTLDREVSDRLMETLLEPDDTSGNGLWLARFIEGLRAWLGENVAEHRLIPLVVDSAVRRRLRQLIAHPIPPLAVLAYSEIPHDMPVDLAATLTASDLGLNSGSSRRKSKTASAKPMSTKPTNKHPR